jgi:hypothetical protein
MSRGAKLALGAAGAIVALNVALSLLNGVLGGTPGGPRSSSYATGATGAAAYAALLTRAGHVVEQTRETPGAATLPSDATVMLLEPDAPLAPRDTAALRRFVASGGDLLVAGPAGSWLSGIVADAPSWSPLHVNATHAVVPLPALAGVSQPFAPGAGSWLGGAALPVFANGARSLLSLAMLGKGSVWLLADDAPLQNADLGRGANAALGLALAGPSSRPVLFLESYHGYGTSSGLAAIPPRWWVAFTLLALAAATLMLAQGRRFGPPQERERTLPPPRAEYVESLAGILARTRDPEHALRPLRAEVRRRIAELAGLGTTPSDSAIRAGAAVLGATPPEAELLVRPVISESEVLVLGRTFSRLRRESPR